MARFIACAALTTLMSVAMAGCDLDVHGSALSVEATGINLDLNFPGGDCAPDLAAVYIELAGDGVMLAELVRFNEDRTLRNDVFGNNPFDGESQHPFASGVFFGLAEGNYIVRVSGSTSAEEFVPDPNIFPAEFEVEVSAGRVATALAILTCDQPNNFGGIDVEVGLDTCHELIDVDFTDKPLVCTFGEVCLSITDNENDGILISLEGEGQSSGQLVQIQKMVPAGSYEEEITVCLALPLPEPDDYVFTATINTVGRDGEPRADLCETSFSFAYFVQEVGADGFGPGFCSLDDGDAGLVLKGCTVVDVDDACAMAHLGTDLSSLPPCEDLFQACLNEPPDCEDRCVAQAEELFEECLASGEDPTFCEALAFGNFLAECLDDCNEDTCGNGVVDAGEDCDDGNNDDDDGCNADCSYQFCGGIAGFPCPDGFMCEDDPRDDCDPLMGGADCGGICVAN